MNPLTNTESDKNPETHSCEPCHEACQLHAVAAAVASIASEAFELNRCVDTITRTQFEQLCCYLLRHFLLRSYFTPMLELPTIALSLPYMLPI